jgi:TatD DNase family protein
MFIDTHCHLQFKSYADDREAVIARCIEAGMLMNTIGTQMGTSKRAVELAEQYEQIYATVGLHPIQSKKVGVSEEYTSFVARGEDFDTDYYRALIQSSDKVIAVGETGLDAYHVPKDMPIEQVFDDQWNLFLKHYELAQEFDLPLVLHVRDAHDEMIHRLNTLPLRGGVVGGSVSSLSEHEQYQPHPTSPHRGGVCSGVVHCFTGNWKQAQAYLDLGFYLGFTGVITYAPKKTDPTAQEQLLEVVDTIPLDRILVETDAPFLAPNPHRGQRSEPWMTREVIAFIADRRGMSYKEMETITVQNTRTLFYKIK